MPLITTSHLGWNGARFAYSDIPETGQSRKYKCANLAPFEIRAQAPVPLTTGMALLFVIALSIVGAFVLRGR